MSAKHTPGPVDYLQSLVTLSDFVKERLSDSPLSALSHFHRLADDARPVIAAAKREQEAAPELLEALENMVGTFDSSVRRLKMPGEFEDEVCKIARAAIAKAKGEA